jgi:hypothetical protein
MSSPTEKRKAMMAAADLKVEEEKKKQSEADRVAQLDDKFIGVRKVPLSSIPSTTKYGTFGGKHRRSKKRKTHRRKR